MENYGMDTTNTGTPGYDDLPDPTLGQPIEAAAVSPPLLAPTVGHGAGPVSQRPGGRMLSRWADQREGRTCYPGPVGLRLIPPRYRTETVVSLCRQHLGGTRDLTGLIADALEESGCTDESLIEGMRKPCFTLTCVGDIGVGVRRVFRHLIHFGCRIERVIAAPCGEDDRLRWVRHGTVAGTTGVGEEKRCEMVLRARSITIEKECAYVDLTHWYPPCR
jgi:hypothetical protein